MNRRAFLRWLGGTAAGVALAPTRDRDRLLWVPGEKTIVLPAVEGVEPYHVNNTVITFDWVAQDVLNIGHPLR